MRRISSRMTVFYKRVFPVFWFGFLALFVFRVLVTQAERDITLLAVLSLIAGIGFFVMKKLMFDLADEVLDSGDSLNVRFGKDEERISLSDIMNVSYSYMTNPARVTLTLRNPSRFGREITFAPPVSFVPFSKSPIVSELIERIEAARQ